MTPIEKAAEFIREGKLVAMPTETVYGLGGDAFNSEAVAKIYETKGRPGDNPLFCMLQSRAVFTSLNITRPSMLKLLLMHFGPDRLPLSRKKSPICLHGWADTQAERLKPWA